MTKPTEQVLEKGVINDKNPQTGQRENRPETDEELAERQEGYDNWLKNYYINKTSFAESVGMGILPATDWTQLLDSNLTDESVKEFASYRKVLKDLGKDWLNETNSPTDIDDGIWDEDYDVHSNLPTEPTPQYKPEETE